MALVYDIFANVFNRKANKKLCDTVTALIRPTDEVLECARGTGLGPGRSPTSAEAGYPLCEGKIPRAVAVPKKRNGEVRWHEGGNAGGKHLTY